MSIIAIFAFMAAFQANAQNANKTITVPNEPMPKADKNSDIVGAIKTASVKFLEPKDGATVGRTFDVKFGVDGLKVAPAGQIEPGTGHFHVLIDTPAVKEGEVIPTDEKHVHYGKGQTEAKLTLAPGKHKLVLQFADGAHRAYGPMLTHTIHVTVK